MRSKIIEASNVLATLLSVTETPEVTNNYLYLLTVAATVRDFGGSEEAQLAAIYQDPDAMCVRAEAITAYAGMTVASMVKRLAYHTDSWERHVNHQCEVASHDDAQVVLVLLCNWIVNLLQIIRELPVAGQDQEKFWEKVGRSGRDVLTHVNAIVVHAGMNQKLETDCPIGLSRAMQELRRHWDVLNDLLR